MQVLILDVAIGLVWTFLNAEEDRSCNAVIGKGAETRLTAEATAATAGGFLDSLLRVPVGSSRTDVARDSHSAGSGAVRQAASEERGGREDARRFYSRYGSTSAEARSFFRNLERLVAR